jgi:hypothetical protein
VKLKKECNKKISKTKEITTKFDIKITWNQMLGDETENKIQLEKR